MEEEEESEDEGQREKGKVGGEWNYLNIIVVNWSESNIYTYCRESIDKALLAVVNFAVQFTEGGKSCTAHPDNQVLIPIAIIIRII